jgi:hypothetical protein
VPHDSGFVRLGSSAVVGGGSRDLVADASPGPEEDIGDLDWLDPFIDQAKAVGRLAILVFCTCNAWWSAPFLVVLEPHDQTVIDACRRCGETVVASDAGPRAPAKPGARFGLV